MDSLWNSFIRRTTVRSDIRSATRSYSSFEDFHVLRPRRPIAFSRYSEAGEKKTSLYASMVDDWIFSVKFSGRTFVQFRFFSDHQVLLLTNDRWVVNHDDRRRGAWISSMSSIRLWATSAAGMHNWYCRQLVIVIVIVVVIVGVAVVVILPTIVPIMH